MNVFSLVVLREALNASARMFGILMRSRPQEGFPLLRLFLDVLERMSTDAHPETVAPALSDFLDRCEARCPGVTDAVLRHRDRGRLRDRDPLGPAPGTPAGGRWSDVGEAIEGLGGEGE